MRQDRDGARVSYFSAGDAELLVLSVPRSLPALPANVTGAEREILQLLLEGKTNAQIAHARGVSPRTVVNQLVGLFRKFDVGSRVELIVELRCPRASARCTSRTD